MQAKNKTREFLLPFKMLKQAFKQLLETVSLVRATTHPSLQFIFCLSLAIVTQSSKKDWPGYRSPMENMIHLNSTNNSCYTCYITGHGKDTQLLISGAHFAGTSASYTGKASLPPSTPCPPCSPRTSRTAVASDPTHPSSKKAGGRSPRYILQRPELDTALCDQPWQLSTAISLHQICLSSLVKSYLYAKWCFKAVSSMAM